MFSPIVNCRHYSAISFAEHVCLINLDLLSLLLETGVTCRITEKGKTPHNLF